MSREFQVYSGAAPQSAQVSGKQVPFFGGIPQNGAAVDAAIGQVQDTGRRLARLHDLGLQQRVTQERERIRTEMDVEMQQAAEVAWGSEESLFRKDGSVNSDRYDAIVAKYWGECEKIEPGEFLLGENAVRYAGEQEEERNGLALRMMKFTALKTLDNTRKAFEDNLALAVGREDWDAAAKLVEGARGSLLNDTEAEVELLKLKRGRLRSSAGSAGYGSDTCVNVGGTEYTGLSAALAMEAARDGGAQTAQEAAQGTAVEGADVASAVAQEAAQEVAQDAEDMTPTLTLMPMEEFCEVRDAFADDVRVLTLPRYDGGVEVRCAPTAPECVQRAAAVGNARGGLDEQQARMMVARIALDAVADNAEVTDAQVVAMFDKAGVYEALGGGDAEVGKERCRAIAAEMVARGAGKSDKLSMGAIGAMIEAHLGSEAFRKSREWGRFEALNPGLEKDTQEWEDRDDERWHRLKEYYYKYRREYNPQFKAWSDHDDLLEEYEEHAQRFYKWYKANKLGDLKKADMEAARDWYTMRVVDSLRQKAYVTAEGQSGYAGYGYDVQVAREVLRELPPARLGAEEFMAASEQMQRQDEQRSAAFRKAAEADYARLRELKQAEAANSAAAAKKREAEAAAERRKAEKAAREAEKQAERVAARKLFVARSAPRQSEWAWDGKNAPDGALPGCLIPEAEYKRLVEELGYDGSQSVYVQVEGARIMVTGCSESGKVELNTPAVAKVQKKPNAKRGERWKTGGVLGYSYYFKATEAK